MGNPSWAGKMARVNKKKKIAINETSVADAVAAALAAKTAECDELLRLAILRADEERAAHKKTEDAHKKTIEELRLKMFAQRRKEKTMAVELEKTKAAHGFRETKPLTEDDTLTPNAARKRLERMVDGL